MRATIAALLVLGIATSLRARDDDREVVKLKDGKALHGRVVLQTDDAVVLRIGSIEKRIPCADVDSVAASLRELLPALRGVDRHDVAALTQLARQGEQRALVHEARLLEPVTAYV